MCAPLVLKSCGKILTRPITGPILAQSAVQEGTPVPSRSFGHSLLNLCQRNGAGAFCRVWYAVSTASTADWTALAACSRLSIGVSGGHTHGPARSNPITSAGIDRRSGQSPRVHQTRGGAGPVGLGDGHRAGRLRHQHAHRDHRSGVGRTVRRCKRLGWCRRERQCRCASLDRCHRFGSWWGCDPFRCG